MAIAFASATSAISSASAGFSGDLTWTGSPSSQLLLAVFGFENVNASSGPWIMLDPTHTHVGSGSGWARVCYQPPSADGGNGLEIWAAIWTSGPSTSFLFDATYAYVGRGLVYTGEYNPGAALEDVTASPVIRAAVTAQVTGDNPAAPSVFAFVGEMLVVCGSDQLQSPGFGTPTPAGYTSRIDSERGGSFGNVEITAADHTVTTEGDTGSIPWTATASTGTTKGATATLAIRPAAAVIANTSPYLNLEWPVPAT